MKRFLMALALLLVWDYGYSAAPENFAETMTAESQTVALSVTLTAPTQILKQTPLGNPAQRTWIVNTSTMSIFISSTSSGLTTSSFAIPGTGASTNAPVIWSPDGPIAPYTGPLFASGPSGASPAPSISIFRSK